MANDKKYDFTAFDEAVAAANEKKYDFTAFDEVVGLKKKEEPVGKEPSVSLEEPIITEEKIEFQPFDYENYDRVRSLAIGGNRQAAIQIVELDKQKMEFEKNQEKRKDGIETFNVFDEAIDHVNREISIINRVAGEEDVNRFKEMYPNETVSDDPVEALIDIRGKIIQSEAAGDNRYADYINQPSGDLDSELAIRILSDLKSTLREVDTAEKQGTLKNFGEGVKEGLGEYFKDYINIIRVLKDNNAIHSLQTKIQMMADGSDVEFTRGEANLMRALNSTYMTSALIEDKVPDSRKVGQAIGGSIGFMFEFGLTSGAAGVVGNAVKKGLIQKAAKRGATGKLTKSGINLTEKLVRAGVQAGYMPTFYKETAKNVANGQSLPSAAGEALYDTAVETFSERLFVGKLPSGGAARTMVAKVMQRMGQAAAGAESIKDIVKATGGEFIEEKFAELLLGGKELVQGEKDLKQLALDFTDPNSNKITFLAVAIMSGMMGGIQEGPRAFMRATLDGRIDSSGDRLPVAVRKSIDNTIANEDLTLQEVSEIVNNIVMDAPGMKKRDLLINAHKYKTYKLSREAFSNVQKKDKKKVETAKEKEVADAEEVRSRETEQKDEQREAQESTQEVETGEKKREEGEKKTEDVQEVEAVEKPFFEQKENVPLVADKISKGETLTEQDLQLQRNFPNEVEVELNKIKETAEKVEVKPGVEPTKIEEDAIQEKDVDEKEKVDEVRDEKEVDDEVPKSEDGDADAQKENLILGRYHLSENQKEAVRKAKRSGNKERLARIFDNTAILTGARKNLTGEEKSKLRGQLVDDIVEFVKTEFELAGDALIERIGSFMREHDIRVEDFTDDDILNSKNYAKKIDELRQEGEVATEKEVKEGEPLVGVRESDRAEAAQEKETEEQRERQFGQKITQSTVLPDAVKEEIKERGIGYVPRTEAMTDAEANEIIRANREVGGLDRVKSEILNITNKIKGDTRITMAVAYTNEVLSGAKKTTSPREAAKLERDAADIFESIMVNSTRTAQELRAMHKWSKVIGSNPEFIGETAKSHINRLNSEFYAQNKDQIKTAEQIIKDFINSDEFKAKYKYEKDVTKNERIQRGKNKVADALSRMASLQGVKKNAVSENNINESALSIISDLADGLLDIGVGSTQELISKLKVQLRAYFTPSEIDALSSRIIEDTNAKKRLTKKVVKIKLEKASEETLIDNLYEKVTIATRPQLKRLLAENLDLLVKTGAIDERSFRDVFAKAFGHRYITDKQIEDLKESASQIQEVETIEKNLDNLFDQWKEAEDSNAGKERIREIKKAVNEQKKAYGRALFLAGVANQRINEAFAEPFSTVGLLAQNIQGNLLTFGSLLKNVYGNVAWLPARGGKNFIAWLADLGFTSIGVGLRKTILKNRTVRSKYWKTITDGLLSDQRTFLFLSPYKGMGKGTWAGTKEGVRQLWYGQTTDDIYRRDMSKALHPGEALFDAVNALKGKDRLRTNELINKFVEGTLGMPPEIMFRLLNLGDKPFRRAAEASRLEELADLKKLKGAERERFLVRPDEKSWEEARKAGLRSTYQQDNLVSNAIQKLGKKAIDSADKMDRSRASLVRLLTVTQIPYVKTPTNLVDETLDYVVPAYALAKFVWFVGKGDKRRAIDYFGRYVFGSIMNHFVGYLFSLGIMSLSPGGADADDEERVDSRVRSSEYRNKPAYYLNVDLLVRLINNRVYGTNLPTEWQEGDRMSSYRAFGVASAVLMAHAEAYKGLSPEEIKNMENISRQFMLLHPALTSSFDQSFVAGITAALNAVKGSDYEREAWITQTSRALTATFLPNTIRAYNQARDNHIRETRDPRDWLSKNSYNRALRDMKTAFYSDPDLPKLVTVWGEEVNRFEDSKSPFWRLFDITRTKTYGSDFGVELHELFERTKDKGVLFDYVGGSVRFGGENVKLTAGLKNRMDRFVGSNMKQVVSGIVNSRDFQSLSDDEKVEFLKEVYSKRVDVGFKRNKTMKSSLVDIFISQNLDEFEELFYEQFPDKAKE